MRSTFIMRLLRTLGFLGLFLGTGYGFLKTFAPKPLPAHLDAYTGYDTGPMEKALTPGAVRAELDAFLACGSRYLGQPGFVKAAGHVREAFKAAGLEVMEYPQQTAAPVTSRREILNAAGQPLPNTEIYPFMPNNMQPAVTPPEGISGTLLLVSDDVLLSAPKLNEAIAVIDAAKPPTIYGLAWTKYAQLGFKAVILAHREGFTKVTWQNTTAGGLVGSAPVNYVRLAATEGIFAHLGERVTLHVRSDWKNIDHVSFVGHFPGAQPASSEALVITSCYDACSMLPDLAPGTLAGSGVAVQLSVLKGLAAYRSTLKRDVIFISYPAQMMALLPANGLAALLGPAQTRTEAAVWLATEKADNEQQAALVQAGLATVSAASFFTEPAVAAERLARLTATERVFLDEQVRYVMNRLAFELSEAPLRTRLAFTRLNTSDTSGPEFKAFKEAKGIYDEVTTATGYSLDKLLQDKAALCRTHRVAERCLARFQELQAYHVWRTRQLATGLEINKLLMGYKRLVIAGSYLTPGDPEKLKGETVSFRMGANGEGNRYRYSFTFNDLLTSTRQRGTYASGFKYENLHNGWHDAWAGQIMAGLPVDTGVWKSFSHPAMTFCHADRSESYQAWGYPIELPYMRNTETMKESLKFSGHAILALAHGEGAFDEPVKVVVNSFGGRVLVANVGRSIVPNFPLAGALIGHKGGSGSYEAPGYYQLFFTFANPYGQYAVPFAVVPMTWGSYSPEAAGYDTGGNIAYFKDEGGAGQTTYKSMNLGWFENFDNVNIVVFRASPVTLFDTINPQSLSAFGGGALVTRQGLSGVPKFNSCAGANGIITTFLEPDRPFYVTLKAGAAENPLVLTTRAFMLNVDASTPVAKDREIDGPGYVAYDTPFILNTPYGIATSMLQVNGRRLALQERYGMADERTQAFHRQGGELLTASQAPELAAHQRHLLQSEAATYAILNHPVLRKSIYESVVGILWYLGLLVPFVFFFEKLAFGYSDIRKQIAAQAGVFLIVFLLLWLLHPAFQMVRSSLMILLGFVVMLVSGGVTIMFSGKFQENLSELRKKRGQVAAAEVNTFGVLGTAFALGLNNMHRRIVRTGLTCATLVLITFAMICFTSIQSNVVNVVAAVGKAAYQGMLVKPAKFAPISDSELFALQTRYGHLYKVSPRRLLLGRRDGWRNTCRNPDVSLTYEPGAGTPKKLAVASVMTFTDVDPLRDRIPLLTQRGWLPPPPEKRDPNAPVPVLISEIMAQEMGVTASTVDARDILAKINGTPVRIYGIFDSEALAKVRDLDDRGLLPFDVEAVRTQQLYSSEVLLAEDDDARQNPARQILAPNDTNFAVDMGVMRLVSVAVHMPTLSYKQAKEEIDRHLEQSGQETYYGLDGIAYFGKIARENSFAGLIEILIPLIIAAMTVLNTMRGSVYERRSEIFVYNAVGIAPRYIFTMFISEAVVYSVVGSVAGYLLSQGTGRVLTTINFTGGLNMTFTSVTTIYASLAIMVAVFVSTYFPARSAMEIAAPAEDSGWRLPTPEGDTMSFNLPFTFGFKDRVAVLAFFHRYLSDHGEGSSGRFFAGPPRTAVAAHTDPLANHGYIPEIRCSIWLKPFDLGVSQELVIAMPTDPETKEFIARLTIIRISGTRESWLRLNPGFVGQLRQNFLYWRAVSLEERAKLYDEAQVLLRQDAVAPAS